VVNNELPGKKNFFTNPAFYPKAVGYKLTRQVFWLVLFICILPELLQWIKAKSFLTTNLQLRE